MHSLSYDQVLRLAADLLRELESVVERVLLVGALRREEMTMNLEFLAIPRPVEADLFGVSEPDVQSIYDCVAKWGNVRRRGDGTVVCDVPAPPLPGASGSLGLAIHLVPDVSSWGWAVVRYTGPISFVALVIDRLKEHGYQVDQSGTVLQSRHGEHISVQDEQVLFRLAGMDSLAPRDRTAAGGAQSSPARTTATRGGLSRNSIEHQGRGMPIERD